MKRYLPLITLLLLAGCRQEGLPEGVASEERMVDFLTEAYQLEGYYAVETRYRYDVLPESVAQRYDSLLDAQGLTREEAERSLDYYSQHLDAYQRIHDSVVARLEVINKTLPAVVPTRIVTGTDSVQRTIPKLVLPKQKALDPQM